MDRDKLSPGVPVFGWRGTELCVWEECGKCYREWNKEKAVSKLDGSLRFLEGDA